MLNNCQNIRSYNRKYTVFLKNGPGTNWIHSIDTDRLAFFYYSFAEIEANLSLIQPKAEIAEQRFVFSLWLNPEANLFSQRLKNQLHLADGQISPNNI